MVGCLKNPGALETTEVPTAAGIRIERERLAQSEPMPSQTFKRPAHPCLHLGQVGTTLLLSRATAVGAKLPILKHSIINARLQPEKVQPVLDSAGNLPIAHLALPGAKLCQATLHSHNWCTSNNTHARVISWQGQVGSQLERPANAAERELVGPCGKLTELSMLQMARHHCRTSPGPGAQGLWKWQLTARCCTEQPSGYPGQHATLGKTLFQIAGACAVRHGGVWYMKHRKFLQCRLDR